LARKSPFACLANLDAKTGKYICRVGQKLMAAVNRPNDKQRRALYMTTENKMTRELTGVGVCLALLTTKRKAGGRGAIKDFLFQLHYRSCPRQLVYGKMI
jgi:hypothetical protein